MLFDVQAALFEIMASTPATTATPATNTPKTPPMSRVSQVSQGVAAETKTEKSAPNLPTSTRAAIVRALQVGLKTPGSIATAAKLGVTLTYQELDRMAQAGLVTMQPSGALGLAAAATEGLHP